jgi:methionyl-tRNA formyltransferase
LSELPTVVFLGTPAVAETTLRALNSAGVPISLVLTAPDKRRGRGSATQPSPVKAAAVELGLAVTHDPADVLSIDADFGVVVAYGRLIKAPLLAKMPFVNLHFSLLPRWRGAAPVERAILAGDERTGVCLMEVSEGLDEGGVYAMAETEVGTKTLDELRAELVGLGDELLLTALRDGFGEPEPQVGEVVYAHKLTVEDRRIDWQASPAQTLAVIRLGDAWTTFRGKRVKVIEAVLDEAGRVAPVTVQPEGKGPMAFDAWRNGTRPAPGEWFS